MSTDLKSSEWDSLISGKNLVAADCWAPWCTYCVRLKPIFEAVAKNYGDDIKFVKVNVDQELDLAPRYGIQDIKFFCEGKLELKNKILEHCGIKILDKHPKMVSRTCGRCGYVNKLESKYCESSGCNYPLTQLALDEIKAAEQAKFQELVNESNLERDNAIQALQQELKSKTQEIQSLGELCKHSLELSSKQNGTINDYKGMVDDVNSKFDKLMGEYNSLKGLLDKSMSTTKTALGGIDELQSVMRGGLLIKPDRRTAEELDRRVKIILQVVPDWKERGASGIVRLTSEEERKVMELINQPKS